ncbi:unnamed protein product [Bemisia tabaci]|uniref:Uncharacterized protein n=1 Tax=Bemisia tabaci TaxID=7038 RepID=A0A9P0FZD0_BEMTA|nr:unnamed protein product [Bemisia tabaci]
MKNSLLFLISVCLTILLFQPCSTASWKIRYWKGLLLLSKDGCANRCKFKHGYFTDAAGETQLAAKAKRGIIPGKCQCMVSPELRKYITQKISLKEANTYGRLNFFGMTKRARNRLGGKVEFITYEQLQQRLEAKKRTAAEFDRIVAANRAAAASNSNPGSGSTTPGLSGASTPGSLGTSAISTPAIGTSGSPTPKAGQSGASSPKKRDGGGSAQQGVSSADFTEQAIRGVKANEMWDALDKSKTKP